MMQKPLRTLILAAACCPAAAQAAAVFEADFDAALAVYRAGRALPVRRVGSAALDDKGFRGAGLAVGKTGGVSFPSEGFPLNRGCVQMWVRVGFYGRDETTRWFFCDSHRRFRLFKYRNGQLYFQVRAEEGGRHAHAPVDWTPGEWHHLACAWEGVNSGRAEATLRLFIDGRAAAVFSGKLTIPRVGPRLFLGCDAKGEKAAESVLDDFLVLDEPRPRVEIPPRFIQAHDRRDYALQQRGATAKASTQILAFKGKDYPADAVIDGRITGPYWASDFIFKTAKGPQWVEVDLGRPRVLGCIKVYMVTARPASLLDAFTVAVERDGEWTTVARVRGFRKRAAAAARADRFAAPFGVFRVKLNRVTARRIRVTVPGTVARIQEIEALPPPEKVAARRGKLTDPTAVNVFDFGSDASPAAEGALPVTNTTFYSDASGYGWTKRARLLGVERAQGYAATRDFVAMNAAPRANDFRIKVPNGLYAVGVIAGDTAFEVQPFEVDIEGQARRRLATADRCECARVNAVVRVADGALDIRVAAKHAWLVSAVVVAPAAKLAAADARLNAIEHQFALGDPGLVKGLRRADPPAPAHPLEPTAAERARGYVVFVPSSTAEQVWPRVPPRQGSRAAELRAWCTPGEYEPVTFAVHALRTLRAARVTVSALRGPGVIPRGAIDVRVVHCWLQRYKSQRRSEWTVMPELLRPQDYGGEIWLPAGTNRQWWLTLRAPADARPGAYRGEVVLEAADAPCTRLPLTLTVYPFSLRWPKPMAWGIYYSPERSQPRPEMIEPSRFERLVMADLRDLRAHGLNTIAFNAGPVVDWSADPPRFDFTQLERTMRRLVAAGFTGPFPVYMPGVWKPDRPDRVEVVRRFVAALERLRKQRHWPELLYYPVDEPFHGKRLDEAVPIYRAFSSAPGVRTYCTVSQTAARRLAPFLDVRCHATSAATGYWWPSVYEEAKNDGDAYWWYSNCTREYPAVMRFKAGFHHWKSRATGQLYWNYRAITASAYCDFDGGPGDHITAYPGADGPVPTIQWECHREGIDDARYAYTLELLLAERRPASPAERRAAALLERIRRETHIALHYYEKKYGDDLAFHCHSDWPPARYDANRRAIADAIAAVLAARRGR